MKKSLTNIRQNIKVIEERAKENNDDAYAPKAIDALSTISEIIKQAYFEDLVGSSYNREIRLFGGKLTLKVFHEPHRNR